MQPSTELLVVTLAQTLPGKNANTLARIRSIADTLRTAPGLSASHIFRGHADDTYYLILTTWEDTESWQQAQKQYNPLHLFLLMPELLSAPPRQWSMSYIWGYSHPGITSTVAAVHLTCAQGKHIDLVQIGWLHSLRQPALQSTLAFAFIARGTEDTKKAEEKTQLLSTRQRPSKPGKESSSQSQDTFLNLFFWTGEAAREAFYADPQYQIVKKFLVDIGTTWILSLELF